MHLSFPLHSIGGLWQTILQLFPIILNGWATINHQGICVTRLGTSVFADFADIDVPIWTFPSVATHKPLEVTGQVVVQTFDESMTFLEPSLTETWCLQSLYFIGRFRIHECSNVPPTQEHSGDRYQHTNLVLYPSPELASG